jgi:hypothetical protein
MKKGMPPGEHVFDKKVKGVEVMVHKEKNKFITYIDGEKLDEYGSQKEAEKAGLEFAKQYKG